MKLAELPLSGSLMYIVSSGRIMCTELQVVSLVVSGDWFAAVLEFPAVQIAR